MPRQPRRRRRPTATTVSVNTLPWRTTVYRAADQLHLHLEFHNLVVRGGCVARRDVGQPAFVVLHLPPQSVYERALFLAEPALSTVRGFTHDQTEGRREHGVDEAGDTEPLPAHPLPARLSGWSRIAFEAPDDLSGVRYSLASLLEALRGWRLSVSRTSLPAPAALEVDGDVSTPAAPVRRAPPLQYPLPHEQPKPVETAIELPWRLILSPHAFLRWRHRAQPGALDGRVELWTTRLVRGATQHATSVRAVYTPDYGESATHDIAAHLATPFRASMTARDRFLVTQRCLHHFDGPVEVEQLALSPWGASANLRGTWGVGEGAPSGNELEAWRHRATFGRDHYVRLVYAGRLFPTGHGASLVKVTERVFESPAEEVDEQVAVLRQRFFLVIKERAREYPVDETWQRDGRDLPFTRIELLTEVTPNLDMPSQSSVVDVIDGGYSAQAAFWPRVGGDDLMFEMVGTDHAGRSISFRAPLLFVSKERELCATPQRMAELANWYNEHSGSERSRVALHGQIIAVAPPGATAGSTDLEVVEVALGADSRREDHGTGRVFRPAARRIRGRVQALATVLGREDPIWFEYAEPYTARGFAGIKGEVFLEVAKGQPAPLLSFTDPTLGRKTGGVVSPSMRVKGISRKLGPVGAGEEGLSGSPIPAGIADGHFTPREFFEGAAMLGSLALEQLLKTGAVENAPRITTRPSGSRIISELRWSTRELKNAYVGVVDFVRGPDCRLRLQATTVVDLAAPGVEPETSVLSELHDFTLGLVREGGEHLLTLRFDKLAFYSRNGGKPDIDVVLRRVQLGGSLGFIRRLQRFIPADGFSDPPDLEVAADGITASYDVGLPSVELGVFSLQNLRLGAGLRLPFNGAPVSAWFYFCRRSDPFALTLGPFGGGGFFELELGADGLERVEAALEARGEFSLDIGIASGGVRVRVGIYWRWTQADLYFEAYFEISGHVSVLGLVSVSVTFFLALGWGDDTSGTYLEGTATMVVEVEILCFSTSVELTVRRRLAGSPADPPFDAVFPATSPGASEAWTNYCDAFAA